MNNNELIDLLNIDTSTSSFRSDVHVIQVRENPKQYPSFSRIS